MQLILYTTTTCPRCHALTKWLTEHGYEFLTKNMLDPEVKTEMLIGGHFEVSAPILQIGEVYHPSGWLFEGEDLREKELRGALC